MEGWEQKKEGRERVEWRDGSKRKRVEKELNGGMGAKERVEWRDGSKRKS